MPPASLELPKTKPCLFTSWTELGQARLGVAGGCSFLSLSGCGHSALVRAAHLRNGELGGLRGFIAAKVDHCATLGHIVHPEAFEQLTVVQVEETPRPVFQASLPVALVAVPILWKKGQRCGCWAQHTRPGY